MISDALGYVENYGDVSQQAFFESLRQKDDHGQAAIEYAVYLAARHNTEHKLSNTQFVTFCETLSLNYHVAERLHGQVLKLASGVCGGDLDKAEQRFWN
jgi:hypothetical protein